MKGFKHSVGIDILSKLLNKDETLKLTQNKWFKRIKESTIEIKKQEEFEVKPTDNKRDLIIVNNRIVGTKNKKI